MKIQSIEKKIISNQTIENLRVKKFHTLRYYSLLLFLVKIIIIIVIIQQ